MALSSHITDALKEAGDWLIKIREEKGSWQDMVYKQQGIVNTAEAWRSLALIGSVIQDVKLPKELVKADCRQLIKDVNAHGFIRSPYYPSNRPHESIDTAAFVCLMLHTLFSQNKTAIPKPISSLADRGEKWLLTNQSPAGGWSWGTLKNGRPLYSYFTYMAIKALQTVKDENAQRAIKRGEEWLVEAQLANGSFAVHSHSEEPDIASTAYAVISMSENKTSFAQAALSRAIRYLLSASFEDVIHVGHLKIVEPGKPPQLAIVYENYAVAANVLLALVHARSHCTNIPPLDDRIQFFVQYLLAQKEPSGGWPKSYSTIYVTHTVIEALVAYLKYVQTKPQLAREETKEHFNPYIFGFPIQHPHLFFGREAIIERIRADINTPPEVKRDIALIGERRIGKTSLLYQLAHHLKSDGHLVFYLDLELMQNVPQFLQTFIAELGQEVFSMHEKGNVKASFSRAFHRLDRKLFRQLDIELQTPFLAVYTNHVPQDMFSIFLRDVQQLLERFRKWRTQPSAKIICLLYEITCLKNFEESRLYSLLRGIAQQTPSMVFIVAGTPEACRIITDEASPFYNIFTPIHLGRLEQHPAIELITRPVKGKISYRNEALEYLLQTSQQHPYILQALCYHCIRRLPSAETEVNTSIVKQAIDEWQLHKDWK